MHQKLYLQDNKRNKALLAVPEEKQDKEIDELFSSLQFFMSHLKNISFQYSDEISSICGILPGLF